MIFYSLAVIKREVIIKDIRNPSKLIHIKDSASGSVGGGGGRPQAEPWTIVEWPGQRRHKAAQGDG